MNIGLSAETAAGTDATVTDAVSDAAATNAAVSDAAFTRVAVTDVGAVLAANVTTGVFASSGEVVTAVAVTLAIVTELMDGATGGIIATAGEVLDDVTAVTEAPTENEIDAVERSSPKNLPEGGKLGFEGFARVYEAELRQGKFWGVAHDLHALGSPPEGMGTAGLFTARYDRIYTSSCLEVLAVRDSLSDAACPNGMQPSDHLSVGASLRLRVNI